MSKKFSIELVCIMATLGAAIIITRGKPQAEAEEHQTPPPERWDVLSAVGAGTFEWGVTNFAHNAGFCEFDTTNGTHVIISGNWMAKRQKQ